MSILLWGGLVILISLIIMVIALIYGQHRRASRVPKVDIEKHWSPETTVSEQVYPLEDPLVMFQAWYQAIVSAKSSIDFSTYVWHVHEEDKTGWVTPHIYVIGLALKALDEKVEKPVRARFLINHATWIMDREYVVDCVQKTYAMWRSIGFKGENVNVKFYVWKHRSIDNIHGKLLLIDDAQTVLTSINVEKESYGGDNSWYESGVWIKNSEETKKFRTFLNPYFEKSEVMVDAKDREFSGELGFGTRDGRELSESFLRRPLPHFDNLKTVGMRDDARANLLSSDVTKSTISLEMCKRINAAKETVWIMTPTFNHALVWDCIVRAAERGVQVRMLCTWEFNVTHPRIQKHLLGYPITADFIKSKMPLHENVRIRWYANKNQKCHRHSGSVGHAKIVCVDDEFVMPTSFNIDTWSAFNSMEAGLSIQGKELGVYYRENLFEDRWKHGVPVTDRNLREKLAQPA